MADHIGTFTQTANGVTSDGKYWVEGTYAGSDGYNATVGDSVPLAGTPLTQVDELWVKADTVNDGGLSFVLAGTPTVPLALIYESNNTELADDADASARGATIRLIGRS